ncbi:MAG: hypothetical protein DHS20C02_15810 [Micavibrio sp.]|nr:MAG: hypothetical protein DHS20C02_15810 [Micavibrio sp.]
MDRDYTETSRKGIFTQLKSYLDRSRLGELLVIRGLITPAQLRSALTEQKETETPLGQVFLKHAMITRRQLILMLTRQITVRVTATIMFCTLSLMNFGSKKARADVVRDIPSIITIATPETGPNLARVASYPALFGSTEKRSHNLKAFTKWTTMFSRFERSINSPTSDKLMREWKQNLSGFQNLSLRDMADEVNDLMNSKKYRSDSKNYGKSDYWATPAEFYNRGGDCEDYAIAKYAALRALGVPDERLRVAIIHDKIKNIPHAVLIVYTDQGAYILDNQVKEMRNVRNVSRYRPIFSINRTAWWLHTAPKTTTILASAD